MYFKNKNGDVFSYDSESQAAEYGPSDLVRMTQDEVQSHENPVMTEEQMKEAEIAQDKQLLADTDWIIAKISEAALIGQDTQPLVEQYAAQLEQREQARIRIRIAEGRV